MLDLELAFQMLIRNFLLIKILYIHVYSLSTFLPLCFCLPPLLLRSHMQLKEKLFNKGYKIWKRLKERWLKWGILVILGESGNMWLVELLQEGAPLPGPETGLLSNTQKWIVRGDMCADKARDFIGKGHLGGEQEGKGIQENSFAMWFYGDGINFWVTFSQSFWLRVLPGDESFSQDGCQREGFWEVVGHGVSPFDLSWALPVGGGLLVPCSLPGPIVKWLMQMVTMLLGQGRWFQSVCFP